MAKNQPKKRRPDFGPWPFVGYVGIGKICGALGGVSEVTLRELIKKELLPPLQGIGLNRVGWSVDLARQVIEELPAKIAASKAEKANRRISGEALAAHRADRRALAERRAGAQQ